MMWRDLKAYEWDGLAFRISPRGVEFMLLSLLVCLCPVCGLFSFIGFPLTGLVPLPWLWVVL